MGKINDIEIAYLILRYRHIEIKDKDEYYVCGIFNEEGLKEFYYKKNNYEPYRKYIIPFNKFNHGGMLIL